MDYVQFVTLSRVKLAYGLRTFAGKRIANRRPQERSAAHNKKVEAKYGGDKHRPITDDWLAKDDYSLPGQAVV